MKVVGGISVGLVCLVSLGCGAGVEDASGESSHISAQALWGDVRQDWSGVQLSATANLMFSPSGGCTGTLVAANKVLTAAHCICGTNGNGITGGGVQFADDDGVFNGVPDSPVYPIVGWAAAPQGLVCPLETGAKSEAAPYDVAVLTIGPSVATGALPTRTPVPPFLDLVASRNPVVPSTGQVWAAGYGSNAAFPFYNEDQQCPGCGVLRSGDIARTEITYGFDACDNVFEADCYGTSMWRGSRIEDGGEVELAGGDSGGPLFFGVGTPSLTVEGVAALWNETSEEDRNRWAATSVNAEFIWQAMELPWTVSLSTQRATSAIYGSASVTINDRAHVISGPNPGDELFGGPVVSVGAIELGTDTLVGDVTSRNGKVTLRDRALVQGSIRSYGFHEATFVANNAAVTGSIQLGRFTQIEPLALNVPFTSLGTDFVEIPRGGNRQFAPGAYPRIMVRAGGALTLLRSGVYVFDSLNVEPGAVLTANTSSGPIWIYVVGNAIGPEIKFEGAVAADPARLFLGVTSSSVNRLVMANSWRGTIVAPLAGIDANMVSGATLDGTFFSRSFMLHQGRYVRRVPFSGNWVPTCTSGFEGCS
jgi:hypothetical protein